MMLNVNHKFTTFEIYYDVDDVDLKLDQLRALQWSLWRYISLLYNNLRATDVPFGGC